MKHPKTADQINSPQVGHVSIVPQNANDKPPIPGESFWDRQKRRRRELAAKGLYPLEEAVIPLAMWNVLKWVSSRRGLKRGEIVPKAVRLLIAETAAIEEAKGQSCPDFIQKWLDANPE